MTDTDANVYQADTFGTQIWMVMIESSGSEIDYIEIRNRAGITIYATPVNSPSITLGKEQTTAGVNVLTATLKGKKVSRLFRIE